MLGRWKQGRDRDAHSDSAWPYRLWRKHRAGALLVGIIIAVYANSFDNSFQYDDEHSIVENLHLRSLKSVPSFFYDASTFSDNPSMAMYRPLQQTTLALNYAAGRLDPFGYHLLSTALHAVFCLLTWRLVTRLTGDGSRAWWLAVVLAVHPINSQIVNYVSSRSGLLAAVGVMAGFLLATGAPPRSRAAAGVHLAALLSKSTALVLGPMVTMYEWGRATLVDRAPVLLGLVLSTIVYLALASATGFLTGSVRSLVRPLHVQGFTQAKALAYYGYLTLMPSHLTVSHPFAESGSAQPTVVASAALVGSLAALAAAAWRRGWVPGFGLLWYVAGLGLTSFMPLNVLVSEQRLYLSGAGLVIVAGAIGAGRRWRWQPVAVLALLLAVMTWHRNEVWDTKLSLWSDAAARGPSVDVSRMDQLAPSARAFWGRVQLNLGEAHFERSEYDEARQAYEEAIALRPDSDVAWTNLAVLRERRGDRSGAEDAYRQAIALQPGSHEARSRLGRILLDRGRSAEAIAMLRQSLSIKPSPIALVNLGVARRAVGDLLEAERLMKAALRLDPEYVEAHVNAAILRAMRGMATQDTLLRAQLLHESTELFEAVFVRQPGHRDALVNLAGVYQAARRHHEAGEVYAQLVADHPDFAPGHAGYGRFLLSQGQAAAAVASLRKASELDSLSLQTRSDLAAALVRQNDLQAAAAVLRETCRLNDRRPDLLYRLGAVLAALAEAEDADGSRAAAEELRREALVAYEDAESLHANFRDTAERLRQIRALLPP